MSKTIYPIKQTTDVKGINIIAHCLDIYNNRWVVTTQKEGIVKLRYSPKCPKE